MSGVVLLVPWRTDNGARERIWRDIVRPHWSQVFAPEEMFLADGVGLDGRFSVAHAFNEAARLAGDWDVAFTIGADVVVPLDRALRAIQQAVSQRITTQPYQRLRLIDVDGEFRGNHVTTAFGSGVLAIPREHWDLVGGLDERFGVGGWSAEDTAFFQALDVLTPEGVDRLPGVGTAYDHPRDGFGYVADLHPEVRALNTRYVMAWGRDDREGMRAIVDEWLAIRNATAPPQGGEWVPA